MKKVIKGQTRFLVLSVFFILIAGAMGTAIQFFKGNLLDSALAGRMDESLKLGAFLLVAIAIELLTHYGYDHFRGKFSVNNLRVMRSLFFKWLLDRYPIELFAIQEGGLVAEYTDQIEQVNDGYLDNIPMLIEISSKAVIVSISLFILDYRVALLTLFLLTMPLYVPKLIEKRLQKTKTASVEQLQKHLGNFVGWLSGFELIKNFSIEKVIYKKFNKENEEVINKLFAFRRTRNLARTITALLSYMSHFIIIAVTIFFVLRNEFTAGEFFIAVGLIDQLSYPIIAVSVLLQELLSTKPLAHKMASKFAEQPKNEGKNVIVQNIEKVEFENVSFAFADAKKNVLENFSLRIKSGEKCVIMGQSGSGKTTGMNLLMGYYEPQAGRVSINTQEVKKIENINEIISVMRQDPILFNDTLRNNLTMYQDMDDEVLIGLLTKLNLHKFANARELDRMILEGGKNLSGGERKRIALGRTLLRKSPIMIIDEPLANVDKEAAERIEDILSEPYEGIVFVITHQYSEEKIKTFAKQVYIS